MNFHHRDWGNRGNSTIVLETWDDVADYVDQHYSVKLSMISEFITQKLPRDAFTLGQFSSKAWMLSELRKIAIKENLTWAILGSWVGSTVDNIITEFSPERVYGIDADPDCYAWSEQLNRRWVNDGWRYKAVIANCEMLHSGAMQFVTDGELINVSPEILINTSSEHMSNNWFNSASENQLVVLQTNNNPHLDGHINWCESLEAAKQRYPMRTLLYSGVMQTPMYDRYMLIGYP